MGGKGQQRVGADGRYRARAARRPLLYWWHAFLLLGVTLVLWGGLPLSALLYEPRTFARPQRSCAAYVTLEPGLSAQVFRQPVSAWTLNGDGGARVAGIELGGIDLDPPERPPLFLEQGAVYPGAWAPSPVTPLSQSLPELRVGGTARRAPEGLPPAASAVGVKAGFRVAVSSALRAARLEVALTEVPPPPERSGSCRFYVETGADGRVEHVLVLSPVTPGCAAIERALQRARAAAAAGGMVEVGWWFPK